jgi:signal transduction histidine kinase
MKSETERCEFPADSGELISRLAHELKNPIAASTLAVQLLTAGASEEDQRTLRQLEQQLRVCDWLLETVLDLRRKAEGRLVLNRSPQPLPAALLPVVEGCEAEFSRKIAVKAAAEITITLDRARVRNAVAHLLRNAFRYGDGDVELAVEMVTDGRCEIRVTDEGPGFPLELLRGEVGSSPDRRGGLGLGLVFCQLIAREHGGELRLENGAVGARASILLPASP